MPYYRRMRTFNRRRGPKPRYIWARNVLAVNTAASYDLLTPLRNAMNITLNIPDITIWRIHLKITLDFHFTVAGDPQSIAGYFTSFYVEPKLSPLAAPSTTPYETNYMMWTELMAAESLEQGGTNIAVTTTTQNLIYHEFDIKTHRRLNNLDDTLWFTLEQYGNVALNSGTAVYSVLCRLPR